MAYKFFVVYKVASSVMVKRSKDNTERTRVTVLQAVLALVLWGIRLKEYRDLSEATISYQAYMKWPLIDIYLSVVRLQNSSK